MTYAIRFATRQTAGAAPAVETLRAARRLGASIARGIGRVLAMLVLWQDRSRQRRQLARCAALLGHRFEGDTLLSSSSRPISTR